MKQLAFLFLLSVGFAFSDTVLWPGKPTGWPEPLYNFHENPLSEDGIYLGRKLFYDPVLSADSTISCASCHSPYNSFAHTDHALSHGIHDSIGRRNAPALVNLAWHKSFMHDGAIHHLDMVPLAPISHPGEMGSSIPTALKRLSESSTYPALFLKAYGDSEITGERTLKAMSQFLLTLVSANAKYDRVMQQKDTFTMQEKKGYSLFRMHCASCHTEPLFTNGLFFNNGLPADMRQPDKGRMEISGKKEDSLSFKVPTLRNIVYTYPYMHDGRFNTLSKVIQHYSEGIQPASNLADQLRKPIGFTAEEKVDLIAFLKTLSDTQFIFNPLHQYPK